MRKLTLALSAALMLALAAPALAQEPMPDLTIEKTGPSEVEVGTLIAYAIDIRNIGDAPAVFPAGSTYFRDVVKYRGGRGHQHRLGGGCPQDRDFQIEPGYRPLPDEKPLTQGYECYTIRGFVLEAGDFLDHQLTSGANGPGTVLFQLPTPGTVTNCAIVDPYNIISESDETNNVSCVTTRFYSTEEEA